MASLEPFSLSELVVWDTFILSISGLETFILSIGSLEALAGPRSRVQPSKSSSLGSISVPIDGLSRLRPCTGIAVSD